MATKTCQFCSHEMTPGRSQCKSCLKWTVEPKQSKKLKASTLADELDEEIHKVCKETWWGQMLGGGLPEACSILLGSEPGGGKSTLALQISLACIRETGMPVAYLPIEERPKQIKPRAVRLGFTPDELAQVICIDPDTIDPEMDCLDEISGGLSLLVCDSLPALVGRNEQHAVMACERINAWTKSTGIPSLIIDHVTKDHDFGGLMALQHYVDITVYMREQKGSPVRTLMTHKNRFGLGQTTCKVCMTARGILVPMTADLNTGNYIMDTDDGPTQVDETGMIIEDDSDDEYDS